MASSDVSSVTNHFSTANEGFTTTTTAVTSSGASTVSLASVTGLTNATIFVGIIEPGEAKEQTFTGTVDTGGSQITDVVWTRGSNVEHSSGVTIVDYVAGSGHNMATKGILVHSDQDGTLKAGAVDVAGVLASNVVTTAKILDANVTTAKLATASVTSEKLSATIACRAYRNASFTITGGGGAEKLILDAESYDTGSDWDTTNGRFTAPITGYYQVNAAVVLDNINDGSAVIVNIYVNGSIYSEGRTRSASATSLGANVADLVYITAGQYIEMYVDCSTTEAGVTGSSYTFMSIYFVGA